MHLLEYTMEFTVEIFHQGLAHKGVDVFRIRSLTRAIFFPFAIFARSAFKSLLNRGKQLLY